MNNQTAEGNYYTIGHMVQFTGLTDRTIRNYIALGILEGEKINGIWHFTPEQVERFVRDPAVKPSIQAKKNAMVFDFLLGNPKAGRRACVILDLPGEDEKKTAEFFCHSITEGDYHDLRFSFDSLNGTPRVILSGDAGEVLPLVNAFSAENL